LARRTIGHDGVETSNPIREIAGAFDKHGTAACRVFALDKNIGHWFSTSFAKKTVQMVAKLRCLGAQFKLLTGQYRITLGFKQFHRLVGFIGFDPDFIER
jgi:hypothetical protein